MSENKIHPSRFLTAGQLSELQRAAAIIEHLDEDARDRGDELLANSFRLIFDSIWRVIADREKARRHYLDENRLPD